MRYFQDIQCPSDSVPLQTLLSSIDHAVSCTTQSGNKGPVHLNFMFRESLAPDPVPFDSNESLKKLQQWSTPGRRTPCTIVSYGDDFQPGGCNHMKFIQRAQCKHDSVHTGS